MKPTGRPPAPRRALVSLTLTVGLAACTGSIATTSDPDSPVPQREGGGATPGTATGAPAALPPGTVPPTAPPPPVVPGAGGGPGAVPPSAMPLSCRGPAVGAGRIRRLTAQQYRNTVKDVLGIDADVSGFLGDSFTGPFATNATQPIQELAVDHYRESAEAVAEIASRDLKRILPCDVAAADESCVVKLVNDLGSRLYRRPVTAEERDGLMAVFRVGRSESLAAGVQLLLEAALQAPAFLYMPETGAGPADGIKKLSGHEVATRLAYLLWNSGPDVELLTAAQSGALDEPAGLQRQAERLLNSARFVGTLVEFHTQLLGIRALLGGGVSKDAKRYPEFDQAMRKAMVDEVSSFIGAVANGGGTVNALFSAAFAFPAGPMAKVYGSAVPAPGADGRSVIADGSRAGLLTLPAFQATHPPIPTHFAAVLRGKAVRTEILCHELAAPPPDAATKPAPAGADKLTQQAILRAHNDNPSCSACHALMDPIGLAFESYNDIGRYVTKAADGSPIVVSGELVGVEGTPRFASARELTGILASSPEVRSCMARQWFRYALGRDPAVEDACSLDAATRALTAGGGDVRQALLTFVLTDAFRYRKGGPR